MHRLLGSARRWCTPSAVMQLQPCCRHRSIRWRSSRCTGAQRGSQEPQQASHVRARPSAALARQPYATVCAQSKSGPSYASTRASRRHAACSAVTAHLEEFALRALHTWTRRVKILLQTQNGSPEVQSGEPITSIALRTIQPRQLDKARPCNTEPDGLDTRVLQARSHATPSPAAFRASSKRTASARCGVDACHTCLGELEACKVRARPACPITGSCVRLGPCACMYACVSQSLSPSLCVCMRAP